MSEYLIGVAIAVVIIAILESKVHPKKLDYWQY